MHGLYTPKQPRNAWLRIAHIQDGERGAALIIALVVMLVMGVLVASVSMFAATSVASTRSYRIQRDERYGGDSAIKTAVNWAATQPTAGRDPNLGLASTPCILNTTAKVAGQDTPIKVSCQADTGGNSGKPNEVGLAPPEAMVLTSDREPEPGPFNTRACTGWWDSVVNFFSDNYNATEDVDRGLIPERGAWFRPRSGTGTLGATCNTAFTRGWSAFKVRGSMGVNSSVRVDNGTLTLVADVPGNDKLYAGNPGACSAAANCITMANRPNTYTGAEAYLNGTSRASDPGRANPSSPNQNPVGDIAAPFAPVGFNTNGTVKAQTYTATSAMPSAMPTRTTAYTWDAVTNTFTNASTACGTSATIVFLPGWYRSANVINQYTAGPNCKNATFWFAPDPGPDGVLLTDDDITGTYLLDFANTPSAVSTCGPNTVNSSSRLCIGRDADANSRVVVGTPDGWSPQGVFTPVNPSDPDPRPQTVLTINKANTVDKDLSQSWYRTSAAPATVKSDAETIDNKLAKYHANICIIWCFSSDRAIRLRDMVPKVTAPPIDKSGAPKGRIYLTVAYGVENPSAAQAAEAVIEAVSKESGRKSCGTYTLYGNSGATAPFNNKTGAAYGGTGALPAPYVFTDAQAKQLADTCGRVDLINGLEIKVQVKGNNFNSPRTDWWLDGVKVHYDAVRGANFPYPTNPSGSGTDDVKAKSDCDPTKAGGQLVFNGDTHVVVGDGTLEVCAGPYPKVMGNPDDHQSIGIWAMPQVAEVTPRPFTSWNSGGWNYGGDTNAPSNGAKAATINGDPMTFNIPACNWFCGDRDAWIDIPMNSYTPPAGYKITKIQARVGYHPLNQGCSTVFKDCTGAAPTLSTPGNTSPCNSGDGRSFPKIRESNPKVQIVTHSAGLMYDEASGVNCIGVTSGGASSPTHSLRWHARVNCVLGICGGDWHDQFDGIAYDVTIAPIDSSAARLVPQNKCITVRVNYNEGAGAPDCALIRAVQATGSDNWTAPWNNPGAHSVGRFSVKGTIYAPSSAIEVDDTDVAYPLATRGVVARHLKVSGFAPRTNYDGIAIDNIVDRTPQPREAVFTACIQQASASNAPCGAGDKILTRARVRFDLDPSEPNPVNKSKIPAVQWWSNDR